jgi:hypothetical protein
MINNSSPIVRFIGAFCLKDVMRMAYQEVDEQKLKKKWIGQQKDLIIAICTLNKTYL